MRVRRTATATSSRAFLEPAEISRHWNQSTRSLRDASSKSWPRWGRPSWNRAAGSVGTGVRNIRGLSCGNRGSRFRCVELCPHDDERPRATGEDCGESRRALVSEMAESSTRSAAAGRRTHGCPRGHPFLCTGGRVSAVEGIRRWSVLHDARPRGSCAYQRIFQRCAMCACSRAWSRGHDRACRRTKQIEPPPMKAEARLSERDVRISSTLRTRRR